MTTTRPMRLHVNAEMGNGNSSNEEMRIQLDGIETSRESVDETRIQVDSVVHGVVQQDTYAETRIEETPLLGKVRSSMKAKLMSIVLLLHSVRVKRKLFGPDGKTIWKWNTVFLAACSVSLFVDPLFFFLPSVRQDLTCIETDGLTLKLILTVIRSVADVFYIVQIYFKFHTAYIAPTSSTFMFGRGSLIWEPQKIAARYIKKGFFLDLIVALPLPQVMIWGVIPDTSRATLTMKIVLRYIVLCQYIPRLVLMLSLSSQTVNAVGAFTEAAWIGAAYNLMLSLLASHVLGACWFFQAIERQEGCWQHACNLERQTCQHRFFDCSIVDDAGIGSWYKASNVSSVCDPAKSDYPFGIYGEAVTAKVTSAPFFNKYFYSLWWGLKNLSSLGQGLSTSTSIVEIVFAIILAILGLVLFALLIGNIQRYLQSTTFRLEEWKIRRADTEQWMRRRLLPHNFRDSVRSYEKYKWDATRGVDEEALLKGLPVELRRNIKRHLCLDLLRRVPLLDNMDDRTLDAICERLKPSLYTESTFLLKQGNPVEEMHFIIRGHLDCITVNGDHLGYLDVCRIKSGDTCGDELLRWALKPQSNAVFPLSLWTVQAMSEVEAFSIGADDLKFVTTHFRTMHSKQLRKNQKFYSLSWRTWAACFIQANWRRHKGIKAPPPRSIKPPSDFWCFEEFGQLSPCL